MRPFTLDAQRIRPWLRAAVVLYLLSCVLLVAVHRHHGATQSDECLLCTMAHTPAAIAPAALLPTAPILAGFVLRAIEKRDPESEPSGVPRSRAPPHI
jgi:hypothetical protein